MTPAHAVTPSSRRTHLPRIRAIALFASALALATGARAEPGHTPMNYFQAGIGTGLASTPTTGDAEGTTDWMLGYRFNRYVGVQAVGWRVGSVQHSTYVAANPPLYDFTSFAGVQAVGYIPCTAYWDLYGELGAGRVHQVTSWPNISSPDKTDGVAGVGARWQMVDHFALSLDVSRLFNAEVTNTTIRAEFNF